jgi:hypothetical protein
MFSRGKEKTSFCHQCRIKHPHGKHLSDKKIGSIAAMADASALPSRLLTLLLSRHAWHYLPLAALFTHQRKPASVKHTTNELNETIFFQEYIVLY